MSLWWYRQHWRLQGILSEGEGTVQLTSSLG
jgi:hypothetical protein